jgi:hypothetical protein
MKTQWLLVLAGLAIHSVAVAQGTIHFSTRAGNLDAPVYYLGELVDSRFVGQLYVGPVNGSLAPSGNPVPFRSDVGRGYITGGGTVEVPGINGGGLAQVKLVAWAASLGATYAEAQAKSMGGVGESLPITIRVGGGIIPPAALIGPEGTLQGFTILSIPEPSTALLGVAGIASWLVLRWIAPRAGVCS